MTRAGTIGLFAAAALLLPIAPTLSAQRAGQRPVFRSGTELVLVNVVVRDARGEVVRGLTQDEFTVLEDGKPQTIERFDFEDLSGAPTAAEPDVAVLRPEAAQPGPASPQTPAPAALPPTAARAELRGRRLIVLFFDLSSMAEDEVGRAVSAADDYVTHKLSPADLVAVASFSTSLQVQQDFTADREAIRAAIRRFGTAAQGLEAGTTGDTEGTPDTGTAFAADDTEYNIFATDRRLAALQSLADAVSGIEQKKSVVYFSSGLSQSGQDNQVQLRRTIDRAVRANVSIYAADMRGLEAVVPGGSASEASVRGRAAFTGDSARGAFDSLAASQDTLTTIAEDTGGRAFFDTNSFGEVFDRVVADTSAYYVLGYTSSNAARDGRFRRLSVKLSKPGLKAEYRSGYYAARDFAHSSRDDRETELQDQLLSDLSATDLSAYVTSGYFRLSPTRYFVPVSVVVPGYQVPIGPQTPKDRATLDVLGIVQDAQKRPVGQIRDTVRLAVDAAAELKRKTIQYETGLELAPGAYRVKVVVRENVNGTFGSYETDLVIPDLARGSIKLSSVVLGTQVQPGAGRDARNPLVQGGNKLVPSVTRVVAAGQHLYFHYELYDPARAQGGGGLAPGSVRVLTSIVFFRGRTRAFETAPVETTVISAPDRNAAVFRFEIPAASLQAGLYTCQVNVVDDIAGTFAFPRFQLYVRR
jgi:VWFA-related protein